MKKQLSKRFVIRQTVVAAALASLSLGASPLVQAHEAGEFIFRTGVAASRISADIGIDADFGGGNYIQGNVKKSNVQAGLNLTYMLTDNLGIDFMMNSSFSHKYKVSGELFSVPFSGTAGKVKQMPLVLNAVYYPLEKTSAFQPYAGLGIHYTLNKFSFTNDGRDLLVFLAGSDAAKAIEDEFKNRWGASALAGVDYSLGKNWLLNAQVRYLRLTASTDNVKSRMVYMAGVGFKF